MNAKKMDLIKVELSVQDLESLLNRAQNLQVGESTKLAEFYADRDTQIQIRLEQ